MQSLHLISMSSNVNKRPLTSHLGILGILGNGIFRRLGGIVLDLFTYVCNRASFLDRPEAGSVKDGWK